MMLSTLITIHEDRQCLRQDLLLWEMSENPRMTRHDPPFGESCFEPHISLHHISLSSPVLRCEYLYDFSIWCCITANLIAAMVVEYHSATERFKIPEAIGDYVFFRMLYRYMLAHCEDQADTTFPRRYFRHQSRRQLGPSRRYLVSHREGPRGRARGAFVR